MQLLIGILLVLLTAIASAGTMILLGMKSSFAKHSEKMDILLSEIDKEFHALRESLPITYVLRGDFLRTMDRIEVKLDRLEKNLWPPSENDA